MSFTDDINRFTAKVRVTSLESLVNVASAVKSSITDGSPVTGSPGQPVDTGTLKASWILEFDSPTSARISTNVAYASAIEDGIGSHGPMTLRSPTGGFHSVKNTVLGFSRLVASVVGGTTGRGGAP